MSIWILPPSASNRLKIFLWVDQDSIAQASGYFIQLGETGSEDRIKLMKTVNGNVIELAQGANSFGTDAHFTLRVTLEANHWSVKSRKSQDQSFRNELNYLDEQPLTRNASDLFMLAPSFTSTRLDKFFFDNITISMEEMVDSSSPEITGLEVLGDTKIKVTFSERIDSASAKTVENFLLEPSGLHPVLANFQAQQLGVELVFNEPFIAGQNYILVVSGVKDLVGNTVHSQYEFNYVQPRSINAYEVVINEIYDDPTPSVGLPLAEFLELFIQKEDQDSINLNELLIRSSTKEITLPSREVPNHTQVILCSPEDTAAFQVYGTVVPVDGFPTLLNGGNDLEVRNLSGKIVHKVSYDDSWYGDRNKDNGGWSLELINPKNACALATNWSASNSLVGGTPGQPNSVFNSDHITTELEVFSVVPVRPDRILVGFNKAIDPVDFSNFDLTGGEAKVHLATTSGRNSEQALLAIDPPMEQGISYQLIIKEISDCLDKPFQTETIDVIIPEEPQKGDIVINEILFNPQVGGVDFVEIYNNSNKAFQIQDLAFGRLLDQGQQLRPITTTAILPSGAYFVFTPDPSDIELRYPPVNKKAIFRNQLPTMPDQLGNIALIFQSNGNPRIIDALDYSETFHSRLLRDLEGVSLERINPAGMTQDPANWHSAASTVGHATPTNPNSQTRGLSNVDQMFSFNPARISPDDDGFEDFLTIDYQLPAPGFVSHIRIYDAAGRLARYLLNNVSLATEGQIKWDGVSDGGQKVPIGIYTILIEAFNQEGGLIKQQGHCVVAGKLN